MGIKRPNISLGTKTLTVGESATFNENSVTDGDFRVESDNKTHMLFVDASTDKVGVGLSSPKTALTVEGAITLKEQADADSDTAAYGQLWVNTATPNELYFTTDAGDDIQITSGTTAAFVGDITGVTAGVGLSGGGATGAVTLTLDLSELSAVTPTATDSFATLDSDGANEQRTTITALSTLQAGTAASTGLSASSGVLSVSDLHPVGVNGSANQLITDDGDGTVTSESNLSFDGSTLAVTGALTTTTTATVGTDLTVTGGDIAYGNGQNATLSVAAVAGTDTAGKNLTISAGQGTGTGDGGSIIFQTASSVGAGSGSSANSLANVVTIDETGKITAPGGLVVDNITLDGVEIALSSGQFTLDIAGDISLDAGGGDIKYKTGGVEYLRITNSSNDVIFGNRVTDKDIIFKEDGGTEVFRMDSSDECLLVTSGDLKFGNTNHAHITVSPVSGTDTAGKDLVVQSGQGTGTGAGGGMQFQVADGAGSTGSSVNSWVTALTIADDKAITCADDLSLASDSAVFKMGAGNDFTITHDGTTGATLAGNPITITSGGACTWSASAGNVTIDSAAAGLILDGHTGVTVQSTDSGNITLDSVADIKLDAAGNDIKCLADTTEFLRLSHSSGDAVIRSIVSDEDLIFKGSDAGSTITALTLDMSAGGAAIFRDMVTVGTDLNVDGGDIVYGNGQDATMSITATAHDTAGKPLTVSAGNTTAGTTNNIAGGALTLNGGQGKGSGAGGEIIFQTAPNGGSGSSMNNLVERMRIVQQGQLKLKESAGDPGAASGYAYIYGKADGGSTEMFVMDGGGNATKISPHDEEGEWEFFSRNTATGKTVKIKMEKLMKRLNDQFGEADWYEETWDE